MATFIMDTYDYAAKLRAVGFTEQQAEVQTRIMAEIVEKQLVSKSEMEQYENALRRDNAQINTELKRDIREAELRLETKIVETHVKIADTNAKIAEAKTDIIKWVIGFMVAQTGLIVGFMAKFTHVI